MSTLFARRALAAASFCLISIPALAHTTLDVAEATIGSSYKAVLRVPHGCDGQATHTVRVTIPEGFFAVKPMPKPGWTLQVVTGRYAKSYDNHGTAVTEGVKEIVWSGGDLPDAFYDEFVFRGTFAETLAPGAVHFPVIQECANGREAWTDTSGAEGVDLPAPSLQLLGAETVDPPVSRVGNIIISAVFSRATLPNAPVGGGFLTLTNMGAENDVLLSAGAPIADQTQLHEMSMVGNIMKMRQRTEGITIPAGQSVTLEPGGLHIMFLGLTGPIVEGQTIPLTLTFAKAGTVTLDMPVAASAADGPTTAHNH